VIGRRELLRLVGKRSRVGVVDGAGHSPYGVAYGERWQPLASSFLRLRRALAEADGHVSVEAVLARIEAHYGERPTRATLAGFAMNAGVGLDGEWITRKKSGEA
jgi:hypothetical protein